MTAIVGLAHSGRVYVGGDSAGVAYLNLSTRRDPKVFRNGRFLIGYTSSFRMGQLLEHVFSPPEPDPRHSTMRYMVASFVPAVRQCLKDGGFTTIDKGAESGGEFIVGYGGELFTIHSDFQVARQAQGFCAVGCGDHLLLGAMAALPDTLPPRKRILKALKIAETFSCGVRGPFHLVSG